MIVSFKDLATADLYHGRDTSRSRRFPKSILPAALRKLDMLDAAQRLDDLLVPPGNRLERLKGDLDGFHSIRVNERWRVIFRWANGKAYEVSLTDYR